jgi:Sec-independent protein secretion pathway component TatC
LSAQTGSGKVVLPSWLSSIVLWTGVVTMVAALLLTFRASTSQGLLAAGLCGLAGAACVVLGFVGRLTRR